jgi:predicted AAA+ superfamily ATPase
LSDTPVVFLSGARQTGKSTLAQHLASSTHPARYLTLDEAAVLAAARHDPAGFIAGLEGPVVIDEVQRVQQLFLAIKAEVDRDPRPGRFLLTGSADILLLPRMSESLAGRMELLTLWPLSQGEITGVKEDFLDILFRQTLPTMKRYSEARSSLINRLLVGGYPALLKRPLEARRRAWLGSYVTTILQRDVRDLSNVEDLALLPRLLSLLASRAGCLVNFSDLSRVTGIPQTTLKRYFTLLETTFLVQLVPAWSANVGKRLVKAPKLFLNDTGLMAYLVGLSEERLAVDATMRGPLLENFVAMELRKQATWSETRPQLFHFRRPTGQEVDLVLENGAGEIVGIEIKASATVGAGDFKGLHSLAELTERRFRRGVVLYTGTESVPFGPQFHALPVNVLWHPAGIRPEH